MWPLSVLGENKPTAVRDYTNHWQKETNQLTTHCEDDVEDDDGADKTVDRSGPHIGHWVVGVVTSVHSCRLLRVHTTQLSALTPLTQTAATTTLMTLVQVLRPPQLSA